MLVSTPAPWLMPVTESGNIDNGRSIEAIEERWEWREPGELVGAGCRVFCWGGSGSSLSLCLRREKKDLPPDDWRVFASCVIVPKGRNERWWHRGRRGVGGEDGEQQRLQG